MPLLKSYTLEADGSTPGINVDGGPVWVSAVGDFGGGDLELDLALDGTNYAPMTTIGSDGTLIPIVLSGPASLKLDLPDCHIRGTLDGSTNPDITFSASKMSRKSD